MLDRVQKSCQKAVCPAAALVSQEASIAAAAVAAVLASWLGVGAVVASETSWACER